MSFENHFAAVRQEAQSERSLASIQWRRGGIDTPRFAAFPILCGGAGDVDWKSIAGFVDGLARDQNGQFTVFIFEEIG